MQKFKYAILRYKPSYILEEQINIGLLFIFEEDKEVRFIYPANFATRLNATFPNANPSLVKEYLQLFEKKSIEYNKIQQVKQVTTEDYLVKESSSLYFSDFQISTYKTIDTIIDRYKQKYFSVYDTLPTT